MQKAIREGVNGGRSKAFLPGQGYARPRTRFVTFPQTIVLCMILVIFSPSPCVTPQTTPVPLAYVRRLAIAPIMLATRPDVPLPPPPSAQDKKATARWRERRIAREEYVRLRDESLALLSEAITARLEQLPGLSLVDLADADAVLTVSLDRFGTHTGLEREVWLRVTAKLRLAADHRERGTYHAWGRGRTGRKLLGLLKGFIRPDADLARDAAAQAARQVTHALKTGQEPPFAREARAVIVPAAAPDQTVKRWEDSSVWAQMPLPALPRHADVLLQPDTGPVVAIASPGEVKTALRALGLQPDDFWIHDAPDTAQVERLAARLRADYVFVSRITGIEMTEHPQMIPDGPVMREGVERHAQVEAEAALLRAADGHILWRDRLEGSTTARTEYVRHQPRLRTDEQCVVDAARIAYAHLRFSLDDWRRRFEK